MAAKGPVSGEVRPSSRFFERFAPQPLIIAHRGYRACYPENTLCAFTQSLGRCRMIELDVQLSGDGVAVVFHDSTLMRTTNAAVVARDLGLASLVLCDWQLSQLRRLDLGSWFLDADPFGTLRRGIADRTSLTSLMPQRILTLREALIWAKANNMPLNIEIKDRHEAPLDNLIVAEVIQEIRATETATQIVVSSFNHPYLRACRQLAPEIATAALQAKAHPPDLVRYLQELGVSAYHPEDGLADEALVKILHTAGLAVNVFTVNNPARQRQLFRFGVTGIFTDFLEPLAPSP